MRKIAWITDSAALLTDKFIEKQIDLKNLDVKIGREMQFVVEEYNNISGGILWKY